MPNINFYSSENFKDVKQSKIPITSKKNSKPNRASVMAKYLDSKDGKTDGNISASVWNEFVKDKGGKTIKYSISLKDAEKSIRIYLARHSKATGKDKGTIAADWTIQDMDKSRKLSRKGNELDTTKMKGIYNPKDPKTIKSEADSVTKFLTGKSESYATPGQTNAAQVFHEVSKNFKGRIPITLGTHLYLMQLYPQLLKQANNLGIKTNYNEKTDFGSGMDEVCKNRLRACIDLKNQILQAEKTKNYPVG